MRSDGRRHLHLYGIRNCDSCRRALRWLDAKAVPHTFHDIRVEPLSSGLLRSWLESPQAPLLINRRSTTWRQLSAAERIRADRDPASLRSAHPTLLKRPVIMAGTDLIDVGFDPARLGEYA